MDLVSLAWPFVTYKISEFIKRYMNETVLIRTHSGPIKGLKQKSIFGYEYVEFRGIPYAKPPLGELRFKDPQPIDPWTEPLLTIADTYCAQREYLFKQYMGSEDCLHLSVYSKNIDVEQLYPVMVCIHGGALQFGSNTKDMHNPEYLLRENIVFVAINYRLGALGFLSIDDPDCAVPGNAGLKDQVMAMKWIKENISIFGGDPTNITIFGNSAGGCSVHLHMLSDMSRGLFHKAICMSGTALNFGVLGTMTGAAEELGRVLGWDENSGKKELLRLLQSVKAKALVDAQDKLMTKERRAFLAFPFVGVVEPYISNSCFMPKHPVYMSRKPWDQDIPMMLGGCSHEGLFLYKEIKNSTHYLENLEKNIEQIVPMQLINDRNSEHCRQLAVAIKSKYFGYTTLSTTSLLIYLQMLGDILCWHGLHRTIRSRQSVPGKTYVYRFNFDSPTQNHSRLVCAGKGTSGTCHADECAYLFKDAITGKLNENSREFRTIDRMVKYWTTFARTGNPNYDKCSVNWEPICKGDTYFCLNISDELTIEIPPEFERMQFWDTAYTQMELY